MVILKYSDCKMVWQFLTSFSELDKLAALQRVAPEVQRFVPVEPDRKRGGKAADVLENRGDAGEDMVTSSGTGSWGSGGSL